MAYQQVTLSKFRARLMERLGNLSATFFTTLELNAYIMESVRVWNSMTGYWKGPQLFNTTTSPWYVVQGTIFSSVRVTWNGSPLSPIALYDLDSGRPNWQSETVAGGGDVPSTPQLYAIGATNLIAIWPSDTVTTNQLKIDGVLSTPLLIADTDFLDIGQEEFALLLDYCEHLALFKEGGAEWEAGMPLLQNFITGATARNGMLQKSNLYTKFMGGDGEDQLKNPLRITVQAGIR